MINYLAQYQANAILTSLALKNPFNYMLLLNNSLFFAKGTNRKCYFHPEDQNLCIKIPFQEKNKRQRRILRNIKRENNYYKKLSESTISWEHLSQYYGDVNTTLGEGSVYQIIRDSEGNIAKSLDEHLQQPKFIELIYISLL